MVREPTRISHTILYTSTLCAIPRIGSYISCTATAFWLVVVVTMPKDLPLKKKMNLKLPRHRLTLARINCADGAWRGAHKNNTLFNVH